MMKGIKEEEDEESETIESRLSEFQPNHKVKILTTTRSLPTAAGPNGPPENQSPAGKFSRQQSLPARRPHPLIRMNSDPKMLPSIELSLSKDAECEMSLNELRKRLENCGWTT